MTMTLQKDYYYIMKIKRQREQYLENLKRKTRKFWVKVVVDYNNGMTAKEIAAKYINPRTGKNYSREHIYTIINEMSKVN